MASLTAYQFRKRGFIISKDMYQIPIKKKNLVNKYLVFIPSEKKIYLSNVYLNFLRDVDKMEQVESLYLALTDKPLKSK